VNGDAVPLDDFPGTVALLQTCSWPLTLTFRRIRRPLLSEDEVEHLLSENSSPAENVTVIITLLIFGVIYKKKNWVILYACRVS
jgi:hypothetical protein